MTAEYFPPDLDPGTKPEQGRAGVLSYRRLAMTPEAAGKTVRRLRERGHALRSVPVARILERLDALHAAWAAPESPLRAEAVEAVSAATGYPHAVVDDSLRGLFASMNGAELARWLAAGGVVPEALDGLVPDGRGGRVGAFGPRLTVVVSSGNIPGAALPSVVQAVLLKSPCLVKTASAEPFLLPMYARSLAAQCPELGTALAVTGWAGGRAEIEQRVLAEADALVVYGADTALKDLRAHLPAHARFLAYGHRISFTALGRECLTAAAAPPLAAAVALDAALFDQQGCLSPQAVYLERGGDIDPEAFSELVAVELERLAAALPRRELVPAEAAAIHQFRAGLEMRAILGAAVHLRTSASGTEWTVAVVPEPELEPCALNRTVLIRPLEDLDELPTLLSGHPAQLISVGLAAGPERETEIAVRLAEAGVTRVTRPGRAQLPETALFHDGVNALAALARFVRVEGP